jgi:hypothetical protein
MYTYLSPLLADMLFYSPVLISQWHPSRTLDGKAEKQTVKAMKFLTEKAPRTLLKLRETMHGGEDSSPGLLGCNAV